jgi:Ca2+/Na+ antiporter
MRYTRSSFLIFNLQEYSSMSSNTKLVTGKVLLSVIALFTIVAPILADWNATHIYNPSWPPHAKLHNAQTMAMAVLLGAAALYFLWRARPFKTDPLVATLFTSLYWVSQVIAFIFPGVAWTDANLLQPGQSLSDMPIQLKLDAALFAVIGLCAWLILRGRSEDADR